jgi:hypothetical protein
MFVGAAFDELEAFYPLLTTNKDVIIRVVKMTLFIFQICFSKIILLIFKSYLKLI